MHSLEPWFKIAFCLNKDERRQQELRRQQHDIEQRQQLEFNIKQSQKTPSRKDSPAVVKGGGQSGPNRRETLTSKLQHHQSKLAQALMGQDGFLTNSQSLINSTAFKKSLPEIGGVDPGHSVSDQMTATEYDSSLHTDSG